MGGAKSTCTVKSSTAGLHGMYFSEIQYASMLQRPVPYCCSLMYAALCDIDYIIM